MDSPLLQIKKYLHVLYCRRTLFVLVAATTALVLVVGCFLTPKQYEAKSTVFIEKNVVNNLMKGLTITPSMNDRIRVLRYHMLSRDIVSRVLKKLDMDVKVGTAEAFESLIASCQEKTTINLKGNDLFFVSIIDPDPQFAKDYINTLVTTYVSENISAKRKESYGAGRFLSEQVAFYKQKLDKLEDAIYTYRKKTGIFTTVTEESIVDEIKDYNKELKTLVFKKNELLATVKTIKEQLKMMEQNPTSGGSADSLFMDDSSAGLRIDELRDKLKQLLLVYNDRYPTVVKLREQIAEQEKRDLAAQSQEQTTVIPEQSANSLEDPIFVDLKMRMNVAQSDLNALMARERELKGQIKHNRRILEKFPQDKKHLADMEHERGMTKNVYEKLLERVGIAEVSKQMEVADKTTTFKIIDPAILPMFPVGGKRLIKMVLGLLAGIAAGGGAVFAREKLDDTVKDAETLRSMGLTVLAEIPLMYNEEEAQRVRKRDRWLYSYAAVCLLFVALLIGHDLLGLTVLDHFIANTHLDTLVSDAAKHLR